MFSLLRYVSKSGGPLRPHQLRFFRAILFAGLLSLISRGLFAQNPRYVTPNGAGIRNGTNWSNALSGTALQGALASAPAGTTFLVGGGLYKPTSTTARTVSFTIPSGVEVYGGYIANTTNRTTNPSSTTLSGDIDNDNTLDNNTFKVVQTSGSNVVLDGLLITQGNNRPEAGGDALGGGLAVNGGSLTLRWVQFINNWAYEGGGMYVDAGTANLTNCSFSQNYASGSGGGLQFYRIASGSVVNCSFTANTTRGFGGGFYINQSNPSLTNCSFFGNSANWGGGISISITSPTLTNCSFSGNSASLAAGAVYATGNASRPVLTNGVIWGNSGGGIAENSGASVTYRYTDSQDGVQPGPGNLSVDPLFANAAGGNLQLTSCSQLINAGDNSVSAGTTDQAGNPRRYNGGIIDMGAYEYQENSARLGFTQQPASRTVVCAGTTVTAMVSVTGSSATYQWYKDGVSLGASQRSATLTLPSVTTAQTGNYSVGVTNTCNSLTSSAFSLTVNHRPTPTLTSSGTLTCAQTSVTLTAGGGTSYVFSGMGIVSQNATSGTAVVNAPGTYSVAVTGSNGCSGSTSVTVDRNINAPQLIINPSSATLTCTTPTVSLSAVGAGTYRWNTGATTSSISVSVANTYSVTLTGANGCSSSATALVSDDKTSPLASVSPGSATLTCATPIVSLSAVGGGTYRWNTGATTASISVSVADTYSVTLTGANGCTNSTSISVGEDRNPPSLTITPSSATLTCATPVLSLTAIGTGSYRWSTGATTSTISVSTAATYSVTLTAANGCSASSTATISQDFAPPSISISPSSATLTCTTPTVSLSAVGDGTYRWSTGATTSSISVSVADTYSVTLTGANGCSSTASVSVSQDQTQPSLTIAPINATLTCASPTVSLSAIGSGTYRWNTGATTSSISVSVAATYSVTVTGANGCTATARAIVSEDKTPPLVSVNPGSATLTCATPVVSLSAVGSGTYRWNTGATTSSISVSVADTYSVTLTGANGCTAAAGAVITEDKTPPSISISPSSATLSCTTSSVSLSAVGNGTYRWNTGATTSSISVSVANTYSVTLTGANGCTATASATVTYQNCAPTVASAIPPQSATLGNAFSFTIPANTFADAETPNSLTLSVAGLPAGLSFVSPNTITGTPSTTVGSPFTVTVVATDPGGQSVSTTFTLTINSRSFAITGVTMLDCNLISYYERRINFVVSFEGTNGQPISLSVVNETRSITINEPYQLNLFTDNPVIIFKARQQGTPGEATFSYNWLAYCANGNPRVENPIPPQSVTVGQAFSYVIPVNTFTDAETPNSLSLSVVGLPAGLSLVAPRTITGTVSATASSFYSVTVIATDPAGGSVSTILPLSVINSTGCASMYSVQAGSWSDASTWSCGRVPLLSDVVTINHAVRLPSSYQGQALRIIYTASGRLIFDLASRLRLGGN
ncbi:hypothetical protein GCM10027592_16500 [Spirosoma flavus]